MISLSASASYGKSGQYIAHITGRHKSFTFERSFIGRKTGKRQEGSEADVDEPGLYECCDINKSGNKESRFYVVVKVGDDVKKIKSDKEDAMKIAKAMDDGRNFDQIVSYDPDADNYDILSAGEAKKADAARTLGQAEQDCWAVLQSLPPKDARKVINLLKDRLKTPEPAE